jgi:hypothetical protein
MGDVISFDNAVGIIRDTEPAHIDAFSFALLIGIFNDLVALRDSEQDKARRIQMRETTTKLNLILARFEPAKGAA